MTLDAAPNDQLLRVTAHLRSGVSMDRPYGLELSGILITQARRVRKMEIANASGSALRSDADSEDPEDYPLPLARCIGDDDWYWATSCAIPDIDPDEAPESRTFFQVVDSRHARDFAQRPIPEIHARKGSYRDVMMPSHVLLASTLTWYAVGDRERIGRMLNTVRAIGRRRATGEGVVREWSVEAIEGDPWRTLHLGRGQELIRPCPVEIADDLGVDYRLGFYAVRPPSWNPNRLVEMAMADV